MCSRLQQDTESLNNLFNQSIQTTDLFKMKQATVFMNESQNHWFTWFIQNRGFIQ